MQSAWQLSVCIADQKSVSVDQIELLKVQLGVQPCRQIRFADRSEIEDLIVFEVKPTEDVSMKSLEELDDDGQLLISIASDNVAERVVIPFNEVMRIETKWM